MPRSGSIAEIRIDRKRLGQQVDAAHAGQADIQEQERHLMILQVRHGLRRRPSRPHVVALRAQVAGERVPERRGVLDHENRRWRGPIRHW
jgi:hypothetical protein